MNFGDQDLDSYLSGLLETLSDEIVRKTRERDAVSEALRAYRIERSRVQQTEQVQYPRIDFSKYGAWRDAAKRSFELEGKCLSLAQIVTIAKKMGAEDKDNDVVSSIRSAVYGMADEGSLISYKPPGYSWKVYGPADFFDADRAVKPGREYRS